MTEMSRHYVTALQVTRGSDVTEDRLASNIVTGETVWASGQIDHDLTLLLTVTPALTVHHIPSPTFSESWRYLSKKINVVMTKSGDLWWLSNREAVCVWLELGGTMGKCV